MSRNQEKKTPVIVVKKRRVISPLPVVDKTESVTPSVPEVAAPPASDADASAAGQNKKGRPPRRPLREHWTREFTDQCMEKVKAIFPHFRAKGGGFLPLKVGISRDIPGWLSTLKPGSPGMNGTVPHPVSPPAVSICVTGVTRYDLDGKPAGLVSEDEAKNAQRCLAIRDRRWEKKQAALAGAMGGEDTRAK